MIWTLLSLYLSPALSSAVITKVETDAVDGSNNLTGSINGGTRLYIFGDGFDDQDYDNRVFVQTYECPIDNYYTTSTMIVCEMAEEAYGPQVGLALSVFVKGVLIPCKNCNVDLRLDRTPLLYYVEPQAVMAGDNINIHGIWRSSSKTELRSVRISGRNCYISEETYEDFDSLSYSGYDYVYCQVPEDMETGDHLITIASSKGTGYGLAVDSSFGYNPGFELITYNLRVHPKIESVSSNQGYLNGQMLTIAGQGFLVDSESGSFEVKVGERICNVFFHTNTEIQCEISKLASVPTNSLFVGGAGLRHIIYDGRRTDFQNFFEESDDENLSDSILLSLENRIRKDNYFQKAYGVFKSTEAGDYTFKLSGDDQCAIYMSADPIDLAQPFDSTTLEKLSFINGWNNFRLFNETEGQITTKTLEANSNYYFILFHTEGNGLDHVSVQVIVPNSVGNPPNSKRRTQKVQIQNSPLRQNLEIEISNATGGTFDLGVEEIDFGGNISFSRYVNDIDYDVSADTMSNKIRSLTGVQNDTTLEMYDTNNNLTVNVEEAARFKWIVNFLGHRSRNLKPVIFKDKLTTDSTILESVTIVQDQSDPIRGNFNLTFDGVKSGNISYNHGVGSVKFILESTIDALKGGVEVYSKGNSNDGLTWFITVNDKSGDTIPFVLGDNNLTGGSGGSTPNVSITPDFEAASLDLVYLPVPSDFLNTINTSPQITVKVNDMFAACERNICDYDYIPESETPLITNLSRTNQNVTMTVQFPTAPAGRLLQGSDPERILELTTSVTAEDIEIKFGNTSCENVTVSGSTVTCQIPQNGDNSLKLEAGNHPPRIHQKTKGYFKVQAGVTTVDQALAVSNVSPSEGSIGGGTLITITGSGFAVPGLNESMSAVTIGSNTCEIVSSSNQEIVCITPEHDSEESLQMEVTFKENPSASVISDTSQNYDYKMNKTPIVSALSPTNASPVLKGTLQITGSNFGTTQADLSVKIIPKSSGSGRLLQSDQNGANDASSNPITYECNVISSPAPTDTSISCALSGGRSGEYTVVVNRTGFGDSIVSDSGSNDFEYKVEVTGISPNVGSIEGGTLLTIDGTNFSEIKNENQVVIGDSRNNLCLIQTATSTQLTCIVQKNDDTPADADQNVYVLARIQEEAVCNITGGCKFQYQTSITPTVTDIYVGSSGTVTVKQGETVTVKGTNFNVDASAILIRFDSVDVDQNTVNKVNATTFTFTMPITTFGSFTPSISFNNLGKPTMDPTLSLTVGVEFDSVSPSSGSRFGVELTLDGSGFTQDMTISVAGVDCKKELVSPTRILCSLGKISNSNSGQDQDVILKYTDNEDNLQTVPCSTCKFNANSESPEITTVVSSPPYDPSSFTLVFSGDYIDEDNQTVPVAYNVNDIEANLYQMSGDDLLKFDFGIVSFVDPNVEVEFTNVPAGQYMLQYEIDGVGLAKIPSALMMIDLPFTVQTVTPISSSFMGGAVLTIPGTGFPNDSNKNLVSVKVCGLPCKMTSSTFSEVQCETPMLYTEEVHTLLGSVEPSVQRDAVVTADANYNESKSVLDGSKQTFYDGANNNSCFLQLDYGEDFKVKASQVRFFPKLNSDESRLVGMKIEYSMDATSWTEIAEIDEEVVENWNSFRPGESETWMFRYIRFSGAQRDCAISEIEVFGHRFRNIPSFSTSGHTCDIEVEVKESSTPQEVSGIVTYSESNTPQISSISPTMGTTAGGTPVTIQGTNFTDTTTIFIDGVECTSVSVTSSTELTCTTGSRSAFVESTLVAKSSASGYYSNSGNLFLYIDRWSDPRTWGGEAPPREGDSVFVPPGQIVLIDESTPVLNTVVVQGVMIFEDVKDLTFDAYFILIKDGKFIAGTPETPHQNKLTITLYGDRYSAMLPGFGNKSIMVQNGQIDINGAVRQPTWTMLASSVNASEKSFTVMIPVDWEAGEKIILAPTSRNRNEVEELTIQSVSANGLTITVEETLKFDHFSGEVNVANKGSDDPIYLRAEVGLLTRNIVVQGDPTTVTTRHGAHIMVRGQEGVARGRFSYLEMNLAGQLFQLGRYPIHYHMIGNVDDSSVIGCSIHDTFNRGTTIHGVHYLTLTDNVYYRTTGHTIFMEDGIETNNLVENNLVVHVSPASSLLMSDSDPAGFWQARPTNFVRNNHFVGSAGNGAWFELTAHPTGPSSTNQICSLGDHLVEYRSNVHHSNSLGLRVYPVYIPKTNPCQGQANFTLRDPWIINPGMPAQFESNLMYMNGLGSFGKSIGAVQYMNQVMVSNATNQSISDPSNAKDSLARIEGGRSIGESEISTFHGVTTGKAISMGNKSGFLIKDTKFYNFENATFMSFCGSCRNEQKRTPGGVRTNIENIEFIGGVNKYFQYSDALYDKDILHLTDGTMMDQFQIPSAKRASYNNGGFVTPWLEHLNIDECYKQENTDICSYPCAICNKNINLVPLKITALDNASLLNGQDIKTFNLVDKSFNTNMNQDGADDLFGINKFRNLSLSGGWKGWLLVLATNYSYNFHFGLGVEWKKLRLENDYYWGFYGAELPTYLRHNHTADRELYDTFFTGLQENDLNTSDLEFTSISPTGDVDNLTIFTSSNAFGDYYYNSAEETITWQLDGKRRGKVETEGIFCRLFCPVDPETPEEIEDTERLWSELNSWGDLGRVPVDGDSVLIEPTWNMILDVDTNNLDKLQIQGRLTVDPNSDLLTLNAKMIEIMDGGELIIGSEDTPYEGNFKIMISGTKADPSVTISASIEPINKSILNKGKLHIHANPPNKAWTRLAATIASGSNKFIPVDTDHGWQIADELIVASSTTQGNQMEKVTISDINITTGEITIIETFAYLHYGAGSALTTDQGEIDMRAEVGNLSRNVVIESTMEDDWGCSILTPKFQTREDTPRTIQGNTILKGVEIRNCGQRDTARAAVDFNFVDDSIGSHVIEKSTFNDGQGWAVNLLTSSGINFSQNIIYNARKTGIFMQSIENVQITDNLIVGVKKRDNYDNVEFWDILYGMFYNDTASMRSSNVHIRNNSVSSVSDDQRGLGYAVPGRSCSDNDSDLADLNFYNNTAHSCDGGWFVTKLADKGCNKFSHFKGYKNHVNGFTTRIDVYQTEVENMILADNRHGISINGSPGTGGQYPTSNFSDSVIIGKALDDCPECYTDATECETSGFYSAVFNGDPYDFYFELTRMPYHNSTSAKYMYGGRQYVSGITFKNFNNNDSCNANSVAIKMNNFYQDNTNAIYMSNITMDNVDNDRLFYFSNQTRHRDTSAFCGMRDCTGNDNTPFFDMDGSILGEPFHYFGPNRGAGQDQDCTFEPEWNGHFCNPKIGQLLMIRPADNRGLAIFPLNLRVDDYDGADIPDSLKFNHDTESNIQLTSLVKLETINVLTFSQTMPSGVLYEMFTAQSSDWTVLKLYSENPATMNVFVGASKTKRAPEVLAPEETIDWSTLNDQCGANYYDAQNRILWVLITGADACKIEVSFANAIQLSTRLDIDPADFFANNGPTTFIDRVAALLRIALERIKIVGVRNGSTIVDYHIEDDVAIENSISGEKEVVEKLTGLYDEIVNELENDADALGFTAIGEMEEPTPLLDPQTQDPSDGSGGDGSGGDGSGGDGNGGDGNGGDGNGGDGNGGDGNGGDGNGGDGNGGNGGDGNGGDGNGGNGGDGNGGDGNGGNGGDGNGGNNGGNDGNAIDTRTLLIIGIIAAAVILVIIIVVICCCCCTNQNGANVPPQSFNYANGLITQSIIPANQISLQPKPLSLVNNIPMIQQAPRIVQSVQSNPVQIVQRMQPQVRVLQPTQTIFA